MTNENDSDDMGMVRRTPLFNADRPKVSLRRFTDPKTRLAIKEYILNRKTLAAGVSLAFVLSLTGCAGTMAKFAAGQGWSDNPPSQQKR
jgi:hypothetical protein